MKDAYLKVTNKYLEEIKANSKYLNTYELSLLNYDILLLKQQNHKSKAEYLKLQQLQTQYNNKKYRGLKRILKNFILNFKK